MPKLHALAIVTLLGACGADADRLGSYGMSAAVRNAAQRALASLRVETQGLQPRDDAEVAELTEAERRRFVEAWQTILDQGWVPTESTNGELSPAELLERAEARKQRLEQLRVDWEALRDGMVARGEGGSGGGGGSAPQEVAEDDAGDDEELAAIEAEATADAEYLAQLQEDLRISEERL